MARVTEPNGERYHLANHVRVGCPRNYEECWRCQRDRAICRSKIAFATREEVDAWVAEYNESSRYVKPVARYPCRWCPNWHMKTVRRKHELRRAERQRRRWLVTLERDTA